MHQGVINPRCVSKIVEDLTLKDVEVSELVIKVIWGIIKKSGTNCKISCHELIQPMEILSPFILQAMCELWLCHLIIQPWGWALVEVQSSAWYLL